MVVTACRSVRCKGARISGTEYVEPGFNETFLELFDERFHFWHTIVNLFVPDNIGFEIVISMAILMCYYILMLISLFVNYSGSAACTVMILLRAFSVEASVVNKQQTKKKHNLKTKTDIVFSYGWLSK